MTPSPAGKPSNWNVPNALTTLRLVMVPLFAWLLLASPADLGMRLGEGSGACLAVNILRSALECHTGMASFAEAGVSEG